MPTFHVHLGGLHDLLVDDKLWKVFEQCRGGVDKHWFIHQGCLRESNHKKIELQILEDSDPSVLKSWLPSKNTPYMHFSISGPRCLLLEHAWQDDLPSRPAQSAANKPPGAQLVEPSLDPQILPPPDTLCSLELEIKH